MIKPCFTPRRTIGMFEQNNVGVRLRAPLANFVDELAPHSALTPHILRETIRVIAAMEGIYIECKE